MSRLINVSDAVYEELTLLKRVRNASYSEAIDTLLKARFIAKKKHTIREMLEKMDARAAKFKGRMERTDHDRILYGDEHDGA